LREVDRALELDPQMANLREIRAELLAKGHHE